MAPCWEIRFAPRTPMSKVTSPDVKVGSYLSFQVMQVLRHRYITLPAASKFKNKRPAV